MGRGNTQVKLTVMRARIVVEEKKLGQKAWDYPAGTIVHEEIRDRDKFIAAWVAFWQSLGLKSKSVTIVLSDEVVFSQVDKKENPDFWDTVPIDSANMAKKTIYEGDRVTMIAVNRELYTLLLEGIEQAGGQVQAVIPASFLGNPQIAKQVNFLDRVSPSSGRFNWTWIGIIAGVVWLGVMVLIILRILKKI